MQEPKGISLPPLGAAVGRGAPNREADVVAVQLALAAASVLALDDRLHPGPADGVCGDGTEGAVAHLQLRLDLRDRNGRNRPDARIDPGGTTATRLRAFLAIGARIEAGEVTFPFANSATHPYHGRGAGMRAFRASRSSGTRAHAGIDLYQPDFTPVLAMADGVVTRVDGFYMQTHVVEVDHGTFLARYGEVDPASIPVRRGQAVSRGQVVGRVGILTKPNGRRLGVPSMMLHLEMYDKTEGAGSGSGGVANLTRTHATSARDAFTGRTFLRRRDLIDPTGLLFHAPLPS